MSLQESLEKYCKSLNGQNRKYDFIYNGREYYEIEWANLQGLVFRVEKENHRIIFEADPRLLN
jgi:hypothetical protein